MYRIFGSEMSPYSVKVRSYFRYKELPHRWILRNADSAAEYQKHARLPIIPLVVAPDGTSLQDSTPLIEHVEAANPAPSVRPDDPVAAFLADLVEEFADEWANKWMFHYRWARDVDQIASAGRIALSIAPASDEAAWAKATAAIRERMTQRVWFVGSNPGNAAFIESSFGAALAELDAHLATRPYLFGARPSLADFALWGQFYCLWTDPTPGAIIEARAPHALAWIQRMLWPRAEGAFESWAALAPTLAPILRNQVGGLFLPWTLANAAAVASGVEEFTVALGAHRWTQKPQKYHARSLDALRAKFATAPARDRLDPVLAEAGCLEGLKQG